MQKQEAFNKIKSLVQRFDEQKKFYKQADYNETQTRRDFIDPFFKALGWDVDNENGYAESYREVIHEDRVKVGGATKAPDYSFRLVGGKRLFFLEAKKPSIDIKDDINPAYQIRRYGWSAKMPIAVITDFEEFSIYDCIQKPKPTDKASHSRIKYLQYTDYIAEFDFIWDTFSKEKVLKGSFDKFIASDKNKKGTSTVDAEFLHSLDNWRIELAKNIALRNNGLTEDELNFVVQNTIDRFIFLRIAEDRNAEPYGALQLDIQNGNFYENLLYRFHQADEKYNSGLFDFDKDIISKNITIDNKVIKTIISELYYPLCPYEFSVLSVEILGSAYEQFLGKQITLTAGGRAKIEEKPEVRKAGGVYYTPQYIVDYIVENTLGKLVENKTPKDVSQLKIVDPACGSGSFLIGAYQYLLDWHKDYYNKLLNENGKIKVKGRKDDVLTPAGELTTAEKKRILINNLYGVDLDSNAVEVTKLSLLLKCMEGETKETIEAQTKLFHDRILPTLDNNIKSGNSLIDLDYYDNELDFGEERKVKPFSWQKAFPEVFCEQAVQTEREELHDLARNAKQHATKAMEYSKQLEERLSIVSESASTYATKSKGGFDCIIGNPPYVSIKELTKESILYYSQKYETGKGQSDLYSLFIERGISLLNSKGNISYIVPDSLNDRSNFTSSRKQLIEFTFLQQIITLNNVFSDANVGSTIFISGKTKNKTVKLIKTKNLTTFISKEFNEKETTIDKIKNTENYNFLFVDEKETQILTKLFSHKNLSEFAFLGRGEEMGKKSEKIKTIATKNTLPFISGDDFGRYLMKKVINYIDENDIKKDISKLYGEKIIVRQVGKNITATIDELKCVTPQSVYTIVPNDKLPIKYLLALLNSKLFNFIYQKKYRTKEIFPRILLENLKSLPINVNNVKSQQSEIIKFVDQLLHLNKDKQNATLPNQLEMIENRITYAEDKINQIIYELYELTDDEIKIIENN